MTEQISERCHKCHDTVLEDKLQAHLLTCQTSQAPLRQRLQPISLETERQIINASYCQQSKQLDTPPPKHLGKHTHQTQCTNQSDNPKQALANSRQSPHKYEKRAEYTELHSVDDILGKEESRSNHRSIHASVQPSSQCASNPSNTLSRIIRCDLCNKEIPINHFSNHRQTCIPEQSECGLCHEVIPVDQIGHHQCFHSQSVTQQSEYNPVRIFRLHHLFQPQAQEESESQEQQIQFQPLSHIQPLPQETQSQPARIRPILHPPPNTRNNQESTIAQWHPARIIFRIDNIISLIMMHFTDQLLDYFNGENQGLNQASRNSLQRLSFNNKQGQQSICCVICQHDIVKNDELLRLRCRHVFHEKCINPWLDENSTCPLCKQDQNIQSNID